MAEKLLDDASFGLVRTNPKLTTNVKVTYTSDSRLFLNSIDASFDLSKDDFKNYQTAATSDYHWDVYRFWKTGQTPNTITHGLGDVADPTQVQSEYSSQYDMTYAMGARYENSRFYDEEFSFFAPIWLNEVLPERFIIFRVDDPSFFQGSGLTEANTTTQEQIVNPANFKQYILDNATIIKSIDMGPDSEIGKYIRNYLNQNDFPTQPINIQYGKEEFTTFSGISLRKGDFSDEAEQSHTNIVARDQTIIEFDNHITKGFERNNLAIANIMNLEFLFDDPEANDFSINRYFGFFVQSVPQGEATALELISLDDMRTQVNLTETIYNNEDIDDLATIFYLKDRTSKFYKIDADSNWDENQVVINEKLGEDDQALLGFSDPVFSAAATRVNFKGYAYIEMDVRNNPRSGDFYFIGENQESYKIIADHNILEIGTAVENRFSIHGTNENIALAISRAINFNFERNELIRAYVRGTKVIVFSVIPGSRYNDLRATRNTLIFNNALELTTGVDGHFIGGSDTLENRIAIDSTFLDTIGSEPHFVDTDNGFRQVETFRFLAFPVTDTDGTIIEFAQDETNIIVQVATGNEIIVNGFGNTNFFTFNKNEYGFFSIFPLKDFDFDFHSTEYSSNDNTQMTNYYESLEYKQNIFQSDDLGDVTAENIGNLLKYDYDTVFTSFGLFTDLLGLENENGELEKVDSEYDRLRENFLKDLATYSRLSPFVCKWVKPGNNVKELPYRLNTNYAFGLDNFSPSFEIKTPNPQYFTHEWYYLGQYPDYINQSDPSVTEFYQFFDSNFDLNRYLDPNNDYFSEYFTIENKGDFSVNTEFKFSSFRKGSRLRFAQTFFRGAKLYIKNRRENETLLNFNVDNLEFLQSDEYNGYKFAAVLQPTTHFYSTEYNNGTGEISTNGRGLPLDNPGERIPKIKLTVIENKKFENITFLIEFKLPESNLYKFFFDSIFLYSYRSVKLIQFTNPGDHNNYADQSDFVEAIADGDFEFVYPDTPLTSTYDVRSEIKDNAYQGRIYQDTRKIAGRRSFDNTVTQALKELNLNADGVRNTIKLYNKGVDDHIWEIQDIVKVVSDSIIFAQSVGKDTDLFFGNFGDQRIDFSNFAAANLFSYYEKGGFDFFRRQIEDASFANIFELVNGGSPEIEYVTIPEDFDGTTDFSDLERNNFVLEFEEPFLIQKSKYLTVTEDTDIPPGLTTETSIGFALTNQQTGDLLPMNRYGGDFFPKFNDVLIFTDQNSEIEEFKNLNREFDINNPNFGIIPNFYYSKVSPESFGRILTVDATTGFSSSYPLIGEIGIDRKDFYIFHGNWELGYYQKNINRIFSQSKFGTWNTLELKNFQASKIMKIPDVVRIEEFIAIDESDTLSTVFDLRYSQPAANQVQMRVFLENRIISKLFELGIADVFDQYVNYDFTLQGDRIAFISDYIRLNILPRYRIDEVIFWVNSSLGAIQLPLVFGELTDVEKIQNGYLQDPSFNYNVIRNSNFDFVLNGNLNTSKYLNFSTAITVRIVKR